MALPGKLLRLREWMTVPETARHLSIIFDEEVNETDVMRLALDGHLKLSVNFVGGSYARVGKVIPEEEVEWQELLAPDGKTLRMPKPSYFLGKKALKFNEGIELILGVWDFSLHGEAYHLLEHIYHEATSGPGVTTLLGFDGVMVESENGEIGQLHERYGGHKTQRELAEYVQIVRIPGQVGR